jgi:hypothetical protein
VASAPGAPCGPHARRRLLAAGIAIAVGATGVLDRLELSSVDERFALRGTQPEPKDVVVVGLDEADLKRVHSQVLPRSLHARVIDNLLRAGARVVAYDIEFSDPSTPHEDAALLTAAKRAGPRLVLGTTRIVRGQPTVLDATDLRRHGSASPTPTSTWMSTARSVARPAASMGYLSLLPWRPRRPPGDPSIPVRSTAREPGSTTGRRQTR